MSDVKFILESYRERIAKIIHTNNFTFEVRDIDYEFSERTDAAQYRMYIQPSTGHRFMAAGFVLVPMINCCGILVSTNCWVDSTFRREGLGNLLNIMRIEIAKYLGYGLLLCTDVDINVPQQKILEKNGWKKLHSFKNPRTERNINIHVINL